ncbi:MAG: TIGR02253 family HAD-type hydrolase [Elusimicrobiales bacterium]|nr:TIGR02253 family HAD-type hydrolase [Elusimicrobiales bacterium]
MIEAVVFDFDNTLMDFMKMKRAAVDTAVDYMIDAGLKIKKQEMIEKIFKVYWEEGIEDQNIFDKVLFREFGEIDYKILAAGIIGYRKAKEAYMMLYPHVRLTLSELLKMGIKLGVVSDAPRLPVWLRIVSLGLHHYFEKVITFDDTNERKPSPKPFLKILEELKVKPQNSIMVGDWAERDIVGAKNIGMITAWAKYGNQFDTKNSGADWELDDIYDLVDIIRKINFGG